MSYVSPMLSSVYSYSTSASLFFLFFFNDTATTEIYTLSLHDALPICGKASASRKSESPAGDPGGNIAKARCTSNSVSREPTVLATSSRARASACALHDAVSPSAARRAPLSGAAASSATSRDRGCAVGMSFPADALPLAPAPAGLAFLDEGVYPFAGILEHHVAGHALGRKGIGVHQSFLHLVVEESLAQAHHGAAVRDDLAGELVHLGVELGKRRDPVHQAPGERGPRVDQVAREEHLERVLAREVARDTHARRSAEDAALDSGERELGDLARHREVAHRHELAACGDRDAVHAGDHGLRQPHERQHHLAALLEKRLLPDLVGMRAHLAKIVPRAKVLARARQHDHASRRIPDETVELGLQRRKHRGRERVHAITAVERQRRHAVLVLAQDVGCFQFGFGWSVHASSVTRSPRPISPAAAARISGSCPWRSSAAR